MDRARKISDLLAHLKTHEALCTGSGLGKLIRIANGIAGAISICLPIPLVLRNEVLRVIIPGPLNVKIGHHGLRCSSALNKPSLEAALV